MFGFKKNEDTGKKIINSAEYEHCLKRISEINSKVEALTNKLENIQTGLSSIRGKLNKRLEGETNQPKPEVEKDLNENELYLG